VSNLGLEVKTSENETVPKPVMLEGLLNLE
jgi:hypothetical protein